MQEAVNRPYYHGDLRQSLIEAACSHLRASCADSLSLRALAREVGVSQTAPYRHFESKNALFAAIAIDGFALLRAELQSAKDKWPDDVEGALVDIGVTYLSWARLHPEKYQLFFDSSLLDFESNPELIESSTETFEVLLSVIRQGIKEGVLVDRPLLEVAGSWWASIHGAASLIINKTQGYDDKNSPTAVSAVLAQLVADPRPSIERFLCGIRKSN